MLIKNLLSTPKQASKINLTAVRDEKVSLVNETNFEPTEPTHIPNWDVTDSDFEVFPDLPELENNIVNNKTDIEIDNRTQFETWMQDYPVWFWVVSSVILIVVLTSSFVAGYFLCCRKCSCKTVKQPEMVIEHLSLAPRQSISGIDNANFRPIPAPRPRSLPIPIPPPLPPPNTDNIRPLMGRFETVEEFEGEDGDESTSSYNYYDVPNQRQILCTEL